VGVLLKVSGYGMHSAGKKLFCTGKKGLDILVMSGNTGLMMGLVTLSFFRCHFMLLCVLNLGFEVVLVLYLFASAACRGPWGITSMGCQ